MNNLIELHEQIATCQDCHSFKEYWKFPHAAHGKCQSGIMVVGESSHKPSIDAGKYYSAGSLRTILESVLNMDQECYLTDLIKCDKSFLESQDDIGDTASCCSKYLYQEIELIKPKLIIAIGEFAFRYLTTLSGPFSKRHGDGKLYQYRNIQVIPIIHPSHGDIHYGKTIYQKEMSYRDSVRDVFRNALNK